MLLAALFALIHPAAAGPSVSLGAAATAATTGATGSVGGRVGWDSGMQLGLSGSSHLVRVAFIDGYEVSDGVAFTGATDLTLPLLRSGDLRLDVELESGVRWLVATETSAPTDRSLVVLADVAPMATVDLSEAIGLRVGWVLLHHLQVRPGFALDAQGSLLRFGLVTAPSPDLQVVLDGQAGGVFGFDGDGGKFLAQAAVGLRWVPGAATTWKNH